MLKLLILLKILKSLFVERKKCFFDIVGWRCGGGEFGEEVMVVTVEVASEMTVVMR